MTTLGPATHADVQDIKKLADKHKKELGFVLRPAVEESIDRGCLWVAKRGDELLGFVRFHHRLDAVSKIYEICVAQDCRGRDVGRRLVAAVENEARRAGQTALALKCPEDLPANGFYENLGFVKLGVEQGKKRRLIVWNFQLTDPAANT